MALKRELVLKIILTDKNRPAVISLSLGIEPQAQGPEILFSVIHQTNLFSSHLKNISHFEEIIQ